MVVLNLSPQSLITMKQPIITPPLYTNIPDSNETAVTSKFYRLRDISKLTRHLEDEGPFYTRSIAMGIMHGIGVNARR